MIRLGSLMRYDFAAQAVAQYRHVFIDADIAAFFTTFDVFPVMKRHMTNAERRDWFAMHNMGGEPYRMAE